MNHEIHQATGHWAITVQCCLRERVVVSQLLAVEHDGDKLLLADLAVSIHVKLIDHGLALCQRRLLWEAKVWLRSGM